MRPSGLRRQRELAATLKLFTTDPFSLESIKASRAFFVHALMEAVLEDYKSGEVDLLQALSVINSAAFGFDPELRAQLLGEMSANALDAGTPRYRGRRKAKYPRWLKEYAVGQVILLQKWLPIPLLPRPGVAIDDQPMDSSVLRMVTLVLSVFRLCPLAPGGPEWDYPATADYTKPLLSWRLLHRWYLERKRVQGASRRRGRPTKRPKLAE